VIAHHTPEAHGEIVFATHTLSGSWKILWAGSPIPWPARLPGLVGACATLLPLVLWVSYRVWRSPRPPQMSYPYLVWLLAVATFFPPLSNDYNLIYLPLAALAFWDRRDPLPVHLLMGLVVASLQPLQFLISVKVLLLFKLGGVFALGVSLVGRVREQEAVGATTGEGAGEYDPLPTVQAAA
jgi:hypothetical protein